VHLDRNNGALARSEVTGSLTEREEALVSQLYRVAQKLAPFLYALTLPNINRFSKLSHCHNQEKILSLKIPPHLKCVATLSWRR